MRRTWTLEVALMVFVSFFHSFGSEGKESERQAAEKRRRRPPGHEQLRVLLLRGGGPLHVGAPGTG